MRKDRTAGDSFTLGVLWLALSAVAGVAVTPLNPLPTSTDSSPSSTLYELQPAEHSIWQDAVGDGFQSSARTLSLESGAALGFAAFGSSQAHDLVLASLSYGHMLGSTVGGDHWHRGNWEWRVELFGGVQYSPASDWLIGLTPHLRYNFATGSRWIPFIDVGAGVTATGIGPPDLSNTFEFNLQGGVGVHWFLRDNLALTAEVHYMHISCAGISQPNRGINNLMGLLGLTRFF